MKLEKEINQKRFRSEHHKLIVNILFSNSWLTAQLKSFLNEHDLTLQQYNILRILRGQHPKPCSVNLLRERMIDKMSDASRIVERLRKKGLAERRQSEEDRRSVEVIISDEGLVVLKKVDKVGDAFYNLTDSLTAEEAETLNSLLDKMRG